MPQITRNQIYILLAGFILLVILLVIFLVSRIPGNTSNNTAVVSPTPAGQPTIVPYNKNNLHRSAAEPTIFQETKEYQDIQNAIQLTEAPQIQQAKQAGTLLDQIPYKGKLFIFDYDYDKHAFRVTFSSSQVVEANKEFDVWLKTNGITSKDTLPNLQVQYKKL